MAVPVGRAVRAAMHGPPARRDRNSTPPRKPGSIRPHFSAGSEPFWPQNWPDSGSPPPADSAGLAPAQPTMSDLLTKQAPQPRQATVRPMRPPLAHERSKSRTASACRVFPHQQAPATESGNGADRRALGCDLREKGRTSPNALSALCDNGQAEIAQVF